MKIRHPRAHPGVPGNPPARVDTGRDVRELDGDGVFAESEEFARSLADRFGVGFDVVDASVPVAVATEDTEGEEDAEKCTTVKGDGEVCGRSLPCSYHTDEGDS